MNFEDRPQAKKGAIGEALLDRYLIDRGYIPYRPIPGVAHPFDRLVASRDKRTVIVADAKAKARRTYYPDTGINDRHYHEYKHLSEKHKLPVFLCFVDEIERRMYGNFLAQLDKPLSIPVGGRMVQYPLQANGIRYWPVQSMKHIADLDDADVTALKLHSTRNPAYDGDSP